MANSSNAFGHTWYVSFRKPGDASGAYVRNSATFESEIKAKEFAGERLVEGCDVSAGTINPHRPKKTIGPVQILKWLDGELPLSGTVRADPLRP